MAKKKKKNNPIQENHENFIMKKLSPKARQEWNQIRPILEKYELLDDLFYPFYYFFCTELSDYKKCDDEIKEKISNKNNENAISFEVGLLIKIRSGFAKHVADMLKDIPIDPKLLNMPSEIIKLIIDNK